MVEDLLSARNVAEYAYCPRLFHYMQAEGVFIPSDDTEKGAAVHRRVDRPSAASAGSGEEEADPERPKTLRSLALTSEALGLTATLDLAEISGRRALPVEYRKGRPRHSASRAPRDSREGDEVEAPRGEPEPWPTDRVQVGLQALLLEEAGFEVPEGGDLLRRERLRLGVRVDEVLRSEALRTLEEAKRCVAGPRPLPLVNDPRCPRCSLQPICLPDEVNLLRAPSPGEEATPRKIWPPREDGIQVVAQREGLKIGIRGMELRVSDKNGATVRTLPLANLESLSLLGSVQISTQAVVALADRNVPVAFLSSAGRLAAMIDPLDSVSAEIRKAQVRRFDRDESRLALARAVVSAKIANQRTLLLRNHPALPATASAELAREARNAARAETTEAVRGHEGRAAAVYFGLFPGMIRGPLAEEFEAHGRRRRPPPDPVNACLSMAYAMLAHECTAALRLARLEPSIGGFHVSRPGRPALALDLMEPFRPLIADSLAITCFNRGELTAGHFLRTASGCALTEAGRRGFFSVLGRRMDTEITHPIFDYRLSYRRMIVLHARMLAAWLVGEIPTLAFLTTR
jgi:CRISPR-associated protein Cas1